LRSFYTALERLDVKSFEAVGQPFDPTRHEAISQIATSAHPPGVVAEEMQRGYTLGNRLLRPALGPVAKAPEEKAGEGARASASPSAPPTPASPSWTAIRRRSSTTRRAAAPPPRSSASPSRATGSSGRSPSARR